MIKWDTKLIFFIIHIFTESLLLCSINSYACLLRESSPKNEKSVIVYSLYELFEANLYVENLYEDDILKNVHWWVPLTSIVFIYLFFHMEVDGAHQVVLVCYWLVTMLAFFKISSFVFRRRTKLIQVWNNLRLRVNKWWDDFHFLGELS